MNQLSRIIKGTTVREKGKYKDEENKEEEVECLTLQVRKFDAVPQHISTIQSNFLAIIAAQKRTISHMQHYPINSSNTTALNGKYMAPNGKFTAMDGKYITLQQRHCYHTKLAQSASKTTTLNKGTNIFFFYK